MKLLDRESSEDDYQRLHAWLKKADTILQKHGVRSEKVHGWCGAESEYTPRHIRWNTWYMHVNGLLGDVRRGTRGRRHGKHGSGR